MKIKLKLKDGRFIESEIIQDITKFRGFYYLMDNGNYVVAKGNSSAIVGLKNMSYTRGYVLTDGDYLEEHLFNKLSNSKKLSKYELLDFYDKVPLTRPCHLRGNLDFRGVLYKHTNIQF